MHGTFIGRFLANTWKSQNNLWASQGHESRIKYPSCWHHTSVHNASCMMILKINILGSLLGNAYAQCSSRWVTGRYRTLDKLAVDNLGFLCTQGPWVLILITFILEGTSVLSCMQRNLVHVAVPDKLHRQQTEELAQWNFWIPSCDTQPKI